MDWNKHRRDDGSIDLTEAHREYRNGVSGPRIRDYFMEVESLQKIRSRQVAASIIVLADDIFM